MKQFLEIIGIIVLLLLGIIAVTAQDTQLSGSRQTMETIKVQGQATIDGNIAIGASVVNASGAVISANALSSTGTISGASNASINGTIVGGKVQSNSIVSGAEMVATKNVISPTGYFGTNASTIAGLYPLIVLGDLPNDGQVNIRTTNTLTYAAIKFNNDISNVGYVGVNSSAAAHAGKMFVNSRDKELILYAGSTLIVSVSNASPEVVIDGVLQVDGINLVASHREKDGIKWKKDIIDPITGKAYKSDEALPVADIADVFEYTLTKEAQEKKPSDFLTLIDDTGRIVKTPEEAAQEYNASLKDIPGKVGVIVENINPKYLIENGQGEVRIDILSLLLSKIADLEKRVSELEGK